MEIKRHTLTSDNAHDRIMMAILSGCHKTANIMAEAFRFDEYRIFCNAIADLQRHGIVVCSNNNEAHEWGYFITEKGFQIIA